MIHTRSPEEIVQEFRAIEAIPDKPSRAEKMARAIAFDKMVKDLQGVEYDKTLFDLLCGTQDGFLRGSMRVTLSKRPSAEPVLLDRLRSEKGADVQTEALQVLGTMQSKHAAPAARKFLNSENVRQRETSLFVLGWVGEMEDIALLKRVMRTEANPDLRITAASALRQIAWHRPETKQAVLSALKEGFEQEKSEAVLPWIIVMIGTVAVKNLGLREDKENPDVIRGDLEKAKKKTAAFLKTL